MRHLLFLSGILGLTLSYSVLAADTLSPADREAVEQQQKALLEQGQQQREALQNQVTLPEAQRSSADKDQGACQLIKRIDLQNVTVLYAHEQRALTGIWLNHCMSLADIRQLVHDISQGYLSRGYVTSQAWLPEQDISGGRLVIAVVEGKIESITREEETPLAVRLAFPTHPEQVLNLRDLEQGMEQLNRLSSRPVTIDIQPGTRPGYSRVLLVPGQRGLPVHLSFGADNSGQKSTGTGQSNAALTLDNPLHLADQWQLAASRDNMFRHNLRSRSLSGNVTLPYGYWLFSYQAAWNDFYQDVPLGAGVWRYEGISQSQRLDATRTLYRDGEQKLGATLVLARRHSENHLAGQRLDTSSSVVTNLTAGAQYSRSLWSGYLTFNPGVSLGLRALGADRDDRRFPDAPRAQFRKYSLSASYFYPLSDSLWYLTSANAQTTPDNLYASERISAGGQYSVRGFKEQYLTGNHGAYWRHELNAQLTTLPVAGEVLLTGTLDGGHISKEHGKIDGGTVAGASAGVALNGRWLSQSVTLGKPLIYPKALRPDPWVVYWQASLSL